MDGQEEAEAVVAEETEAQPEIDVAAEDLMPAQAPPARRTPRPRKAVAPPAAAAPEITTELMDITAELAHKWLRNQNANRSIRTDRVTEFARDMRKGKWRVTGEALKFNPEGKLLDGQHRLLALLEVAEEDPDFTVTILTVWNVPDDAQDVMDTNSRRTGADQFKIKGYANYAALAAAAKWSIIWERKALYAERSQRIVSHTDQLEFVKANPRLEEITSMAAAKSKYFFMPLGFVITAWWVLDRIDDEQAKWFFERMADGTNLPELHPILALRNSLILLRVQKSSMPADVYLSMTMRTWNAMRQNKNVQKMQLYKDSRPIKCPDPI